MITKRSHAVAQLRGWALGRWLATSLLALLAFGALLVTSAARAQPQAGEIDPPGRAARLAEITGQVWLWDTDAGEWITVSRNRPLTTGDRIATDNGARAEIWLGSTTVRLDSASELEIARLDDEVFALHLHGGSVEARLRSPQALPEFSLSTDEGRFRAQTVGSFRFDRFDQSSDLTVLVGQAVFEGRNSALPLTAGQHARFWLDAAGAAQYSMSDPPQDAFAAWIAGKNRAETPVAATRYVSPEMTGAEDLDRHGRWEQSPEYGAIWYPRNVAADWVPYSTGHWSYVRPWGWTWVDAAPWGFAPFHYGRWVHYRSRWCWAPGSYVARPVYAPALVAWVGGARGGVSISVGAGGPPVGWFPLAPREVWVPGFRASPRYVRNVNITHVSNVTQITTIVNNIDGARDRRDFANRRFPHAVTVAPASVFGSREQVHRYRGDARLRAIVAESRPGPVFDAAPVSAPQRPPRSAESRPQRPPFADGRGWAGGRPGGADNRPGLDARRDGRPLDRADAGRRDRDDDRAGRNRDDDRTGRVRDDERAARGRDDDDDRRGRNRDDDRRGRDRRDGDRSDLMPGSDRRDGRFDRDRGRTDGATAATPVSPPRGPAMREPNADASRIAPVAPVAPIVTPPPSMQRPPVAGVPPTGAMPREPRDAREPRSTIGIPPRGEFSRAEGARGDGPRGNDARSGDGGRQPRSEPPRAALPQRVETPQRMAPIEPQRPMTTPAVRPPEVARPAEPIRPVEPQQRRAEPPRAAPAEQKQAEAARPERREERREERQERREERRENRMERGGPSERSR